MLMEYCIKLGSAFRSASYFTFIMMSTIFLMSSLALAGGKGKNKNTPPGWEQGEKTGWQGGEKPPGLTEEKIEKKHKEKYESEIDYEKEKHESEQVTEKEKIKASAKKKES